MGVVGRELWVDVINHPGKLMGTGNIAGVGRGFAGCTFVGTAARSTAAMWVGSETRCEGSGNVEGPSSGVVSTREDESEPTELDYLHE